MTSQPVGGDPTDRWEMAKVELSLCEHEPVCLGDDWETAQFFPDLQLNYAEDLLWNGDAGGLIGCHADSSTEAVTKRDLRERVAQLATSLRRLGVRSGDRVAEKIELVLRSASFLNPEEQCLPIFTTFMEAAVKRAERHSSRAQCPYRTSPPQPI